MSGTIMSGPSVVAGPLLGAVAGSTPQEYGVEFGPSISYQGDLIPDVRFSINKDNPTTGSIRGILNAPYFLLVDTIPAASNTTLTTAGNATSGTALVNVTAAVAGVTPAIPFYQFNTTTLINNALCLDFGWGNIAVTAATALATPAASPPMTYYPGQWLVIGNVGNAGGTVPLITQVATVNANGTILLNSTMLPAATNATAPVGSGNSFNFTNFGAFVATGHMPYLAAGLALAMDPQQTCMRAVGINGSASATGGGVLVRGYDVYGQPQSELITHVGGAVVTWGKKTFKWFLSATPQFSDAHAYNVVTSDTFGFGTRSDRYEYCNLFYASSYGTVAVSTASAWTAADQTNPATTTTGDPRGTFQVSTRGANATVTAATFTNGTNRIAMFSSVPLYNLINATPNNPAPLFGVVPV